MNPFFDERPYVSPSLNMAKIVALPGVELPNEVRGKTGYKMFSSEQLIPRILKQFPALAQAVDVPRAFDDFLTPDHPQYDRAMLMAEEYGRNLGYLLLMLKRGDPVNRAARAGWADRHWVHWGRINTVWVGGGLMAGRLGQIAVPEAAIVLHENGQPDFSLNLSPYGSALPLIGCARTAPATAKSMLLFDFGQTSVKRAAAFYQDGRLTRLHQLASYPSDCGTISSVADRNLAEGTADHFVNIVADTWEEAGQAGWPICNQITASLACYLVDGQPAFPRFLGCYGRISLLADHMGTYLARRVSEKLTVSLKLRLIHDGTAAAMTYAGSKETAVLTFGTAIGNGFPPSDNGLLELRPSLELI